MIVPSRQPFSALLHNSQQNPGNLPTLLSLVSDVYISFMYVLCNAMLLMGLAENVHMLPVDSDV